MRPSHGMPYTLLGHRLVFTDWAFVHQGGFGWRDAQGNDVWIRGDQDAFGATFSPGPLSPSGVRLTVAPAQRSGPVLKDYRRWDDGAVIMTLLRDGDSYKAWLASGWGDLDLMRGAPSGGPFVCYMESRDGYAWTRPDCGRCEFEGSTANSIVARGRANGFSVFIDPSAPAAERYKLVAEAHAWTEAEFAAYRARWPDDFDVRALRTDAGLRFAVLGATSPDGIAWTFLPEPLVVSHCDSQVTGCWDRHRKEYVLYTREYADLPLTDPRPGDELRWISGSRRAIGRTASADFRHFPLPRIALEASPGMGPSESLYGNAYTSVPGAPERHLLFPTVWSHAHDTTHVTVASSLDGSHWRFLTEEPVLRPGPFGSWDGGCVFASPNLVELPDGSWALPYQGYNVPHKYPRVKATRNTGYALWPHGRLAAVSAEGEGRFTTIAVVPPGDRLHVNALLGRTGSLAVAALDRHGAELPGRGFADCLPLIGDLPWAPVRWRGGDTTGIARGDALMLAVRLTRGDLYGLEFRSA